MRAFTYYVPTRRVFGPDTERGVGEEVLDAGGSRVLVLYGGGSAVRSGLLDLVLDSLQTTGLVYFIKGGYSPIRFSAMRWRPLRNIRVNESIWCWP